MAAEDKDLEAVREWLSSEVKLKQYFDKLVLHGFKTLKTCSAIDENVLDMLEIKPPYHRKRFLMFSKSLRERLNAVPNPKEEISLPRVEQNHDFEKGNDQQNNIITFDDKDESKSSSLYLNSSNVKRDLNNEVPALPPKKMGKPPPIPRRTDLEREDTKRLGADSASATAPHVPPALPKKAAPIKPPRKSSAKNHSREMELDGLINSDLQGESSGHSRSETEGEIRRTEVCQPLHSFTKEQGSTYSKNIQSLCDSSNGQIVNDYKSSSKEPGGTERCSYGSVKGQENQHMLSTIEPRPAPKPPTRSPMTSSSLKKPVPVPRPRLKSEECIDVSVLPSKIGTKSNNKAFTRRPMSFSIPGGKQITPTSEKSSTLPRYAESEKRVPPTPPARQITTDLAPWTKPTREPATNSFKATDKASSPNMPQPQPVVSVHEDKHGVNAEHLEYESIGPGAFQSAPSQGSGASNFISPAANATGNCGQYSLVGADQRKSFVADTIYETVDSNPGQDQESNEVDYESDDCLSEEAVDDLLMVDSGKAKSDSVDGSGGSNDARASRSILSPRVRKSEGYLWKQGGQQGNKGWKRRWFVFDGKELRYHKDKDSLNESLHIIPVSQIKDIENVKDTKRASFKVITPNRTFLLASENLTEMNLWSQTLMEAILMYKADNNSGKTGGEMSDPDKEGWIKKQGHNVVADWRKRYLAIKEDKICYYDTYEDFVYATPINCINAALAKVKTAEGHRNRFLVITPNKSYSFQAETETEAASWIVSIETAIQKGLGDQTILEKVYENPSNRLCADCGMKDPVWASVNFCVCVCAHCIGAHRNLGVHCSKPRSLLMDEKIWNPSLLELMVKIGNSNANQLLEHKLPDDDKITPETDSSSRREFIYSKYWEKKYCKYHQSFGNTDELGKVLQKTVVSDDYMGTLELILNKVDMRYISPDSEDEKTPLELAEESGQILQAELLRQNGAEGGKLDRQMSYEDLCAAASNEVLPTSPAEVVYEKEGFLYKKEGSWRKRWFLLKERDLKYTRGPHDREELGIINLRTVTSLVKCPKGEPLQLDIVTVDKTHSLKAETDEELEAWYSTLRTKQVFGVFLSHQELGSDGIPHLVAKCLQFVESYGGLQMEGVYRVNGGQLTMKKLVTSFDQDAGRVLLTLDECGVHDVTGVLKQYLRRLPEPVIPGDMYEAFIRAGMNPDHNVRLQTIKDLITALPKVNHNTLKEIVFHLTKVVSLVAVNKMGIPNIAMIFGPTLMSNEQTGRMDDASINQEFSIVGDMITYFYWLFDVKEEEVRKDQIMQDALQKIRRLQTEAQPSSEEFTLDIYVNQTSENPCRLKVSSEMTARMVCAEIVSQRGLPADLNWALFEVIGNGAMERAFQVREKVLAASKWGSGNYLIVKENYIAEQIAPYVGSTLSIEGPLHIRDPKNKSWKQSSVCLKNGYMLVDKGKSFFKAIKSDKSDTDQWPLHKLTLYVGIPVEKSTKGLDTSCGFTVVIKTDQEDFTRYMCAKDKRDMYRWLAAVLNMKHPEGIWSDPSQRETVGTFASESKGKQAEDMPLYLGRQSFSLRRKGSSKHIVEELRLKQKSLKRPFDRGPRCYPQVPS